MEGKSNNNINKSQNIINESTSQNTAGFNPYTSPYPLYNDTFEINWNTEIANILRAFLATKKARLGSIEMGLILNLLPYF